MPLNRDFEDELPDPKTVTYRKVQAGFTGSMEKGWQYRLS